MICPNCHQEISSNAAFCGNCGFRLGNSQTAQNNDQAASDIQPQIAVIPPLSQTNPAAAQQPAFQPVYAGANGAAVSQAVAPPPFNAEAVDDGSRENSKAVIAFVLGVLGCVGWLIPIVGVVLGVLAIVFGTMALKSQRRVLAIIGMVLAVLVMAVSIFFWVRTAENVLKSKSSPLSGLTTQSTSSSNQTITSPCYITKIPSNMTFDAVNNKTGEEYVVKVLQVPGLSTANLAQVAQLDAKNTVNISPGSSISSERTNTFAGSPAYLVYITDTKHNAETVDYVFDTTQQGNIVVIAHLQVSGKITDLSTIENNWAWQ